MAPTTRVGPPSSAVAGDYWKWRVGDVVDHPQSEGWTLTYELTGRSNTKTFTAVWQTSGDDENSWLVTVAITVTDDLEAGLYYLHSRMVGSGDYANQEYHLDSIPFEVLPNPRSAIPGLFQTHEERALEVIEAALEGRLTKDMENYSIAGRSISKIPIETLVKLRSQYQATVNQQKTGSFARPVKVHFPSVGA
jgi:hypothetical protein